MLIAGVLGGLLLAGSAFALRSVPTHDGTAPAPDHGSVQVEGQVRLQLVAAAPTANDSAVVLPATVTAKLREIGMDNGKIALTRVDSTGDTTTSIVDLTPRISDQPDAAILKVKERALAKVDDHIAAIVNTINNTPASTGSRALYQGLLKTEFDPDVPVIIVASTLDLADPVDARKLGFDVDPKVVAGLVSDSGELPDLGSNPVTYVQVAPAGSQEQLRHAQKAYMESVWRALLMAGQASSVDFVDAVGLPPVSTVPAPNVPLPALPGTPVKPKPKAEHPTERVCELSASTYFKPNRATLIDRKETERGLAACVAEAGSGTTVDLDAWTAYYGPLDSSGRPLHNPASDVKLSQRRARAIAKLMVSMGMDPSQIVRVTGHGNAGQPDPDSTSAKNRVVVITIHHDNTNK